MPATYQTTDWDLPVQTKAGPRCWSCKGRHQNTEAVRACHQISRDLADQQAAECWAEDGWLRAAEAGTPDTWADEDRERMIAAYGPRRRGGSELERFARISPGRELKVTVYCYI